MNATPKTIRVLLVDDDDTFRQVMSAELSRRGYDVASAASGRAALQHTQSAKVDVILLDLRLPQLDGIEILKRLQEQDVTAGVIVLTGHGTIDTAIQAMRLGAADYLEKPCPVEKVEIAIQKTFEHLQLMERERVLQDGYTPTGVEEEFIGASKAYEKIRRTVARIAPTESTTLILGETGVGKGLVAKLLHAQGLRKDKPFVVMNCASLHENLLQSELFGHEKGAFTGASRQRHGLFEVADGGSLLLDEVGDMSPEIQAKLLRVLDTGCFRRLGSTQEIEVDIHVISATNRNLKEALSRGRFREDLFFRLSTLTIEIPPLRERKEDILVLVKHFTQRFNQRFSLSKSFSAEALEVLSVYSWPGNVRELIHALEQAILLTDRDVIEAENLPPSVHVGALMPPAATLAKLEAKPKAMLPMHELQRRHVLAVMNNVDGNKSRAAQILQISERNLYRLLKKYAAPAETSDAGAAADEQPLASGAGEQAVSKPDNISDA